MVIYSTCPCNTKNAHQNSKSFYFNFQENEGEKLVVKGQINANWVEHQLQVINSLITIFKQFRKVKSKFICKVEVNDDVVVSFSIDHNEHKNK